MCSDRIQRRHGLGHGVASWIRALDVIFELAAEFADGVFDGPGGAVGQATNGRTGDDANCVADFQKQIQGGQDKSMVYVVFGKTELLVQSFVSITRILVLISLITI